MFGALNFSETLGYISVKTKVNLVEQRVTFLV